MTTTLQLQKHSAADFADAMRGLLPPGQAWQWPKGGTGDKLLMGMAQELARIDTVSQVLLDDALSKHKPKYSSWRLSDYQAVADASQAGITEPTRTSFAAGSKAGRRLWHAPLATFAVPLVVVSKARPFTAGSKAGDALWGTQGRYVVVVRYFHGVVDFAKLVAALMAFKQAHAFLFFQDITHAGAEASYG